MSVVIVLIIAGFCLALTFLALFLWAVKTSQYEDTYTPSIRILTDDNDVLKNNNNNL